MLSHEPLPQVKSEATSSLPTLSLLKVKRRGREEDGAKSPLVAGIGATSMCNNPLTFLFLNLRGGNRDEREMVREREKREWGRGVGDFSLGS